MNSSRVRLFGLAAAWLAGCGLPARADYETDSDYVAESPTRGTYAVVHRSEAESAWSWGDATPRKNFEECIIELWISSRPQGAVPNGGIGYDDAVVKLRDGEAHLASPNDRLIARGTVPWYPDVARVMDTPPSVVLLDPSRRGMPGHIGYVDSEGRLVFSRNLADVAENWMGGFNMAVNEKQEYILLIGQKDILMLRLLDGAVAVAVPQMLISAFQDGFRNERQLCLRVAARYLPTGLGPAASLIADDASSPMLTRLIATVAEMRSGGGGRSSLFLECLDNDRDPWAQLYATLHLGEIVGKDAVSILTKRMLAASDSTSGGGNVNAHFGLALMGERARRPLVEIMEDSKNPIIVRTRAAEALGCIASPRCLKALDRMVDRAPEALRSEVLDTLINAAFKLWSCDDAPCFPSMLRMELPPFKSLHKLFPVDREKSILGIERRMIELLEDGCPESASIASYFGRNGMPAAIPALKLAIERANEAGQDVEVFDEALESCENEEVVLDNE